jgi:hypothetical protein
MNEQNEADVEAEALTSLEALSVLIAAGREYDPTFVLNVVEAAGSSISELKAAVKVEMENRLEAVFAQFDGQCDIEDTDVLALEDSADADDDENELIAESESSDHCDSLGRRLWNFDGHVPPGATACIYHEGRKLREIKATHGHFEIQAEMPRGMQTIELLAIGADGRKIGSNSCVFKVD